MKAEILDGLFVMMNRPKVRHTHAASKLGALLIVAYEEGTGGPGGWTGEPDHGVLSSTNDRPRFPPDLVPRNRGHPRRERSRSDR